MVDIIDHPGHPAYIGLFRTEIESVIHGKGGFHP